tara:strand:+ start:974 stop:2281 length:1308 start_codon:yes stop_codon:yes gene_type:complete
MKSLKKIIFINTLVFIPLFITSYLIINHSYKNNIASKIGWRRWWKPELIEEENELGYRGRKFMRNYNEEDIVILVGDSQVETSHPFNLMPENILEESINSKIKGIRKIKVRSIGSWGFSNVQQYIAIKETLEFAKKEQLKIPLVLLFFTTNDYTDNLTHTGFNGTRAYIDDNGNIKNLGLKRKFIYSTQNKLRSIYSKLRGQKEEQKIKFDNNNKINEAVKINEIYNLLDKSSFWKANIEWFAYLVNFAPKDFFDRDSQEFYKPPINWDGNVDSITNHIRYIKAKEFLKDIEYYKVKPYEENNFWSPIWACRVMGLNNFHNSKYVKNTNKILLKIQELVNSYESKLIIFTSERFCWFDYPETNYDENSNKTSILDYRNSLLSYRNTFKGIKNLYLHNFNYKSNYFDGLDGHLSNKANILLFNALTNEILTLDIFK